jgi:hypothetical protein
MPNDTCPAEHRYGKVEIKMGNTVLHSSKNLRALLEHQNRVGIEAVSVHEIKDGGLIYVTFKDQSWCRTFFTDYKVALYWVRARRFRWGLDIEVRNSDSYWSFMEIPVARKRHA